MDGFWQLLRFIARSTRRLAILVVGLAVVAVGIVLIPAPGPGWLVVFTGLAILATEFTWAEILLERAKHQAMRAKDLAVRSVNNRRRVRTTPVDPVTAVDAAVADQPKPAPLNRLAGVSFASTDRASALDGWPDGGVGTPPNGIDGASTLGGWSDGGLGAWGETTDGTSALSGWPNSTDGTPALDGWPDGGLGAWRNSANATSGPDRWPNPGRNASPDSDANATSGPDRWPNRGLDGSPSGTDRPIRGDLGASSFRERSTPPD